MANLYEQALQATKRMLARDGELVPTLIIYSKLKTGINPSLFSWKDTESRGHLENLVKKGLKLRKIVGIVMIDEYAYRTPLSKSDAALALLVAWDLMNGHSKKSGLYPIHRKAKALTLGDDLEPEDVPTWLDAIVQAGVGDRRNMEN